MEANNIILNASEHLFNLGFSETLMLRNYARNNNYEFCSMIGGAESIRDIQEARNLGADAYEFSLVESLFSMDKIFSALGKVFVDNLQKLNHAKVFINISTPDGLKLISDLPNLELPSFLKSSNLIFNFDRRSLTKNLKYLKDNNFEYSDYELEINPIISKNIVCLKKLNYLSSISGGIEKKSFESLIKEDSLPNFLKTGLFTLNLNNQNQNSFSKYIIHYQGLEAKLLNLMRESMYYRFEYLNHRQMHLMNYLIESIT